MSDGAGLMLRNSVPLKAGCILRTVPNIFVLNYYILSVLSVERGPG
jgi:hypothetical protein